jgi:pterin-4a-carbinolamine dehydratase
VSRRALAEGEAEEFCRRHPRWRLEHGALLGRFDVPFACGADLVQAVSVWTSIRDHHPDVTVTYGYTEVRLSTHDRPTLTLWDVALAEQIERWLAVVGY